MNLGILEIITFKPEAYAATISLSLEAGAPQSIHTSYIALIDVVCNLVAGNPGQSITSLPKETMDHLLPGWMTFPAATTVSHVVYDPRDPKKFYAFPPQPSGESNQVRAVVSMKPPDITSGTEDLPLDDSYRAPLLDYIIFRALAEETTVPNALAKANQFYNKFLQGLGIKQNTDEKHDKKGR